MAVEHEFVYDRKQRDADWRGAHRLYGKTRGHFAERVCEAGSGVAGASSRTAASLNRGPHFASRAIFGARRFPTGGTAACSAGTGVLGSLPFLCDRRKSDRKTGFAEAGYSPLTPGIGPSGVDCA